MQDNQKAETMDKKVIIIPTYNEKENIEKMIRALRALDGDYHVLVIDDGSWTCGKGQSCPVSCGIPTVLINNLTVGGE